MIWGCPALGGGEWRCGGCEKEEGVSSNIVGGAINPTTRNLEKEAAFFSRFSSIRSSAGCPQKKKEKRKKEKKQNKYIPDSKLISVDIVIV